MLLLSIGTIYWDVFIGIAGMGFFMYGRKRPDYHALILGIILMGYPYFVDSIGWNIAIGMFACALYFILKRL